MIVEHLNHFTLRCLPGDLDRLRAFYVDVLGLNEGARPEFSFPGYWLYSGDQPIVHLAGLLESPVPTHTGALDHIAFTGRNLKHMQVFLREKQIEYEEAAVPGFPLYQIFLRDPLGLKIELTFQIASPEAA